MKPCRSHLLRPKWHIGVVGVTLALALLFGGCDTSDPTSTYVVDVDRTSLPIPSLTGTLAQTPTPSHTQTPSVTSSPTTLVDTTPTGTPSVTPADIPARISFEVIGQLGGQSNAVALDGGTAYLGVGPRVLVLDVSTPDLPRLLGQSVVLRATVRDIFVVDHLVYVAAADAGIYVLDATNRADPTVTAVASTQANAEAIAVEGDRAYVAEEHCDRESCTGALSIFDASDPSDMRAIGRIEVPNRAHSLAFVEDTYALMAHDGGLAVIDVTDPKHPQAVTTVTLPGPAEDVLYSDGLAYVASYGLRIAELADPAVPSVLDAPATFGIPLHAVAIVDNHALVVDAFCEFGHCGSTLRALDISDPTAPREVGLLTIMDAVESLAVRDGLAFMAARRTGLYIADLSDLTQMEIVGRFGILGNVASVAIDGDFAYVADGGSEGLQVVDIAEPTEPKQVGGLRSLRFTVDIALSDGLAYVPVWLDGFRTIDISEPPHPRQVGTLDSDHLQGTPDRIALADGTAYLAAGEDGMKIVDVSDPTLPKVVSTYSPSGSLSAIAVTGEHVYATGSLAKGDQREGSILVVDVKDRSNPIEIARAALPIGTTSALMIAEPYAYVAHADCYYSDCSGGLHVIDIAELSRPRLLGSVELPGGGFDVAIADGDIFVAAGDAGVWVVDVTNPQDPLAAGMIDTPGRALALSASDGLLHVADDSGGLVILQVNYSSF